MLEVAALGRAAAALGLPLAACRLEIESHDRAAPGAERAACSEILEHIAGAVAGPSGWLWGDTGLVRVSDKADLLRYDGILFSAEVGSGTASMHVRTLAEGTWRVTLYREIETGVPTHLAESVTLLGASLRDMPDLGGARARYRRYWLAASDDRSRPVAARLLELR